MMITCVMLYQNMQLYLHIVLELCNIYLSA